jgi:hypothetical protein
MHSTSNLNDEYFGSGIQLWRSIHKHGKSTHTKEILEFLPDRKTLAAREHEMVNESLLADPMCMNLAKGGEAGGFMNSDHAKKCQSAGGKKVFQLLNERHCERLKTDEEYRAKYSKSLINSKDSRFSGRTHTEESKNKMRDSHKGKGTGSTNSQFGTKWMTHPEHGTLKVKVQNVPDYTRKGYLLGRSGIISS